MYWGSVGDRIASPAVYLAWPPDPAQIVGSLTMKLWMCTTEKNHSWSRINPGTPSLWTGAVGSHHSSTSGYYFIAVGFILNPPYLLCPTLYECDAWCRVRDPKSCWMAPNPNTNHWKPDIELLKVHYGEKSPLIERALQRKFPLIRIRSRNPWVSGQVLWDSIIPAPMVIISLLLFIVTQYSLFTVSYLVWVWCMEGYGSHIPIDGSWPKHKTLEAWHWNAESALWRKIAPHQGSIQGPPGLWAGAVGPVIPGSRHSSTRGYHFFVVVFILNTHYLLCPTLYECDAWCIGEGWGSHSLLSTRPGPWPKHKPLEARHWNAESALRSKLPLIKDWSRDPWVGAVGSHHSSTRGYHFIVVVFILNTHYLLCPTSYECDVWCIGRWSQTIGSQKYFLTIYCVLPCMSVIHDALGED